MTHPRRDPDVVRSDRDASLRRRLRFEGDCRYLFDRVGASLPGKAKLHRVPERLAIAAFDVTELLRTRRSVPSFGHPKRALDRAEGLVPQHPRYLGYWHDPERRAVVGMELGVDVIPYMGTYYIVEMNLSTGRPAVWSRTHPGEMDPGLINLAAFARGHGFTRLVAFRKRWPKSYRDVLTEAGRKAGVDAIAVEPAGTKNQPGSRMAGLPNPPERDTMYIVFSSRSTAVDHFVHDKGCTSSWLPEFLPERSVPTVRSIPTRHAPFLPDLQPDPRWPDLVVKFASLDMSLGVKFVKLEPGADLLRQLEMDDPHDRPGILRPTGTQRLRARLMAQDEVLYQPFIPSDLTPEGRPFRFRLHCVFTPVGAAFLSASTMISLAPLAEKLPPGIVEDARPFLAPARNLAPYFDMFESGPEWEEDFQGLTAALGDALDRAVRATFETGP